MKFNKIKISKILFLSLFLSISISAAEEGVQSSGSSDPFARTDYAKSFNPNIFGDFKDVREYDGSATNTPPNFFVEIPIVEGYTAVPIPLDSRTYAVRKSLMEKSILAQLAKCKRDAVLRPVYENGLSFALQAGCIGFSMWALGTESMGGSFGGFAIATSLGFSMRQAIPAVWSYIYPGNDPYARFEQQFAKKMPYIPHQLWPQIIDTFGAARLGRFSYVRATNFFDIAFNLPVMHRFPYLPPLQTDEILSKANTINRFTDEFFANYENSQTARTQLRATTRKYLTKLATDEDGFVCVHLEGPGGVGKTHYIKALAARISEVLGTDIPVEEINIRGTDSSELEGDQNTPGKVLAALSRVAKKGKPYGILVFDEAAWLNGPLKEPAKKMFEPILGLFTSQYLAGMDFSLKGFLIAFMSNDPISDPALSSRMSPVKFPTLKKESLRTMALAKLRDQFLDGTGLRYESTSSAQEIRSAIEASTTMRDIGIKFPTAIEEIIARG